MGWSSDFLTALAGPTRDIVFTLEVPTAGLSDLPGQTGAILSSHATIGGVVALGSGLSVAPYAVTPHSWVSQGGGCSVQVALQGDMVAQSMVRGSLVVLKAGFRGWSQADMEPIFIGRFMGLRGSPGRWIADLWDAVSPAVLRHRWSVVTGEQYLFNTVPVNTTVHTDYTPGDANIIVNSASSLERETSGTGLIKVTPDVGDDFYIKWNGRTGNTLNISAAGAYGTTDAAAAAGNAVKGVALVHGHPVDLTRKLLTSTGAGTNGSFDKYPKQWGWGIPVEYLDSDLTTTAGGAVDKNLWWDLIVEQEQRDAYAWLVGYLQTAGLWLTQRQGQITMRAACEPVLLRNVATLDDSQIAAVLGYESFAVGQPAEYRNHTVSTDGTSSTSSESLQTLPGEDSYTRAMPWVYTNEADARNDAHRRCKRWAHRIAERLDVITKGLSWAQYAVGDPVKVSTGLVQGRTGSMVDRYGIIVGLGPAWTGNGVNVSIAIPPDWSGPFP